MKPIVTPKHAGKKTAEYINAFNEKLSTSATLQQRRQVLLATLEKAKTAVLSDPSESALANYSRAKIEYDNLISFLPDAVTIDPGTEEKRALAIAEEVLHEIERSYDAEKLASEKDEVAAYRGQARPETIRALDKARDEVQAARNAIPKLSESERVSFLRAHMERPGFWESVDADFSALAARFDKAITEARKTLASSVSERILAGEDYTVHDYTTPTGAKAGKALEVVKLLESKLRFIRDSQIAADRKMKGGTHGDTLGILSALNAGPEDVIKQIEGRK